MRHGRMFFLLLILVLAFVLRVPFFNIPLDYDEGIYAFAAFFSKGDQFYSSLPLLKLPGIIFTYRFLDNLFPGEIAAFRVAAALLVVLAAFGVYKLGGLLHSRNAGIFSALIFALFSSQISLESPANTEFFMIPFTVLALWLFWVFLKRGKLVYLILSGLGAGVAVFYKQVAVFGVALLGLWLLVENLEGMRIKTKSLVKQWFIFGISFSLPLLMSLLFFSLRGELADFWQRSFGVGVPYIANAWKGDGWFVRLKNAFTTLGHDFRFFWLVSLLGVFVAFAKREKRTIFLVGWGFFASIGAIFNGWFFAHYFIQTVPPVSLLGGVFIAEVFQRAGRAKPLLIAILLAVSFLAIEKSIPYYLSYLQMFRGEISRVEYLERTGADVGDAGWLPFYEASDYLGQKMEKDDTLFVWGTTPLPYYLTRKYPITSAVRNRSLLDHRFLLPTYRGWSFDFEANRVRLMKELSANFPTYILISVSPEKIFDQMFLFDDFSNFVSQNYQFEKKFGNILIYRRVKEESEPGESGVVPLEIVKRFAAITDVEESEGQTIVTLEPMVNPKGILRSFKVTYSEAVKISFEPISGELLGKDGSDYVGRSFAKPLGVINLRLKVTGVKRPLSFVRVKEGGKTWNNKSYGVNRPLKVVRNGDIFDLYFEPPPGWQGKTFEVYIIYEDGSLSRQSVSS